MYNRSRRAYLCRAQVTVHAVEVTSAGEVAGWDSPTANRISLYHMSEVVAAGVSAGAVVAAPLPLPSALQLVVRVTGAWARWMVWMEATLLCWSEDLP